MDSDATRQWYILGQEPDSVQSEFGSPYGTAVWISSHHSEDSGSRNPSVTIRLPGVGKGSKKNPLAWTAWPSPFLVRIGDEIRPPQVLPIWNIEGPNTRSSKACGNGLIVKRFDLSGPSDPNEKSAGGEPADLEFSRVWVRTIPRLPALKKNAVVIPVMTQYHTMLQRNLLYTGVTRGERLVVLVGQRKAVAIAVRNISGRRRWSKLTEWLRPRPDCEF
jgi:UvrD-like helicase C-terminal domain